MTTRVPEATPAEAVDDIRTREAARSRELEEVLASMPLRVWRSDEVTPLTLHPNDLTITSS